MGIRGPRDRSDGVDFLVYVAVGVLFASMCCSCHKEQKIVSQAQATWETTQDVKEHQEIKFVSNINTVFGKTITVEEDYAPPPSPTPSDPTPAPVLLRRVTKTTEPTVQKASASTDKSASSLAERHEEGSVKAQTTTETKLDVGPGWKLYAWGLLALALVLCAGVFVMWRRGWKFFKI